MKKNYLLRKLIIAGLAVATISAVSGRGVKAEFSKADEVRYRIMQFYKDNVPAEILTVETIEEMIKILDDKYTKYFTAEEYQDFVDSINRQVYGIGVYIKQHEEGLFVSDPIEDGPSEKAGILSGDIIIKADDVDLKGMTITEAANYVKGKEGTSVKITVKRKDVLKEFEIIRTRINLPTVEMEWLNDNSTAHVIIRSFGQDTSKEFYDIIKDCEKQGVENYIIDLRYNGGGYMDQALKIAGMFLGDETVLVTNSAKEKDQVLKGIKNDLLITKPCIVLTNDGSASASEILSAALKDYDKAYFIGDNTYGKGVAQSMINISGGGALKITAKEFFSPNRRKINGKGISPNLEIKTVNSLIVAEEILKNYENDNKELFFNTEVKQEKLISDKEFGDNVLNGWTINAEKFDKIVKIKSGDEIKVKFNKLIFEEFGLIRENVELINGKTGERVDIEFEIEDETLKIKPISEIDNDLNYILIVRPEVKSNKGIKLERGNIIIIDFE